MNTPTLCLERATHARGAGKGIMRRADSDSAPFQGSENEWKEPRLVADVPHDAPWARPCLGLRETPPVLLANLGAAGTAGCAFDGIANP